MLDIKNAIFKLRNKMPISEDEMEAICAAATAATVRLVHCVRCIEVGDPASDVVHIFSSAGLAAAFCEGDTRPHVVYDYAIDVPERMEQRHS